MQRMDKDGGGTHKPPPSPGSANAEPVTSPVGVASSSPRKQPQPQAYRQSVSAAPSSSVPSFRRGSSLQALSPSSHKGPPALSAFPAHLASSGDRGEATAGMSPARRSSETQAPQQLFRQASGAVSASSRASTDPHAAQLTRQGSLQSPQMQGRAPLVRASTVGPGRDLPSDYQQPLVNTLMSRPFHAQR